MSHVYTVPNSRPLDRDYKAIGVNKGEDVTVSIEIDDQWINSGYNVTIYDEKDGTTLASASADESPKEITIDDFAFDAKKCQVVIEDRSDINNIETEETIGYIFFKVFERGNSTATLQGSFEYVYADDSTESIKYYNTSFS